MSYNQQLGTFAEYVTVNTAANSVLIGAQLSVGNSTVNTIIGTSTGAGLSAPGSNTYIPFNDSGFTNTSPGLVFSKSSNNLTIGNTVLCSVLSSSNVISTVSVNGASISIGSGAFTANSSGFYGTLQTVSQPNITANNSTNFNGNPASYYTNATNITSGTLPGSIIPSYLVNTSANFIYSGVQQFNGNVSVSGNSSSIFTIGNTTSNVQIYYDPANNAIATFYANVNNYIELNMTNFNTGNNASADFSIYDTGGITGNNFIDMGILGTGYSQSTWTINGPSDGYLYTGNTNLSLGTAGSNYLNFFTGGTLAANERMRITPTGNVGIGNTAPTDKLSVNGTTTLGGNTTISGFVNASSGIYGTLQTASQPNITANNTSFVGTVSAANVVSNSQLSSNLSNYALLSGATFTGNVVANNANTTYDLNVGRNLFVSGNLIIGSNVTVIGSNNLSIGDNMIYMNSNSTYSNPDIGIAANYNDGTYHHTGIFRDHNDGSWKVFDNYLPEPDANIYIQTTNTTFHLANFMANGYFAGNTSTNWAVVNTSGIYTTGTINAASYTVGTSLIANTTGVYHTGTINAASITVGSSTVSNSSGVYASVINASSGIYGTLQTASQPNITANNASYLGGTAAASYLTTSSASSTYAPLASPTFTGTVSVAQANVLSQTLTDGATISWNTASGQVATVTLGGNRTVAAPTNLKVGTYILHVYQDGTGGRTLTWNSVFKWPAGIAPVLSTAAGAHDVISLVSDGTNLYGSYLTGLA
jgi:hypothetical protein